MSCPTLCGPMDCSPPGFSVNRIFQTRILEWDVISSFRGSSLILVAQTVKKPPAMSETWILSLGWDDPLEKGIATHSSILAWRIPWTEETGRPQSMGLQRLGHDLATNTFPFFPGGSGGKESACLRSDL